MSRDAEIMAETQRLHRFFKECGALSIEPDFLQPADILLDLYGEDIRARAYLISDPLRGEKMLRPDYTVPVVQAHMKGRANSARYTYAGKVFRKQEKDIGRPSEYIQVGYECFGDDDPARSDADVFAALSEAISGLDARVQTGDMNVLMTAVSGLHASDDRKAALLRHIWRPQRFRILLERFSGRLPKSESRTALLTAQDTFQGSGPFIGLRSKDEIKERVEQLRRNHPTPLISETEMDLLTEISQLCDVYPVVLSKMHDLMTELPSISQAIERIERRLEALEARGIDTQLLSFEASYGQTSMEYYDGFVFGFYKASQKGVSLVATGGRYDALTRHLGNGIELPAVGGVIRPDLLVEAKRSAVWQ